MRIHPPSSILHLLFLLCAGCSTAPTTNLFSPAPPPTPVAVMSAKLQAAVESSAEAHAVAPTKGAVALAWESLDSEIWIYSTNGVRLKVVTNFNNCVIRGLVDGQVYGFYAVAVWPSSGISGDPSNIAFGTASKNPWLVPSQQIYARNYKWKCAPNITNVLQYSINLKSWSNSVAFKGTNGTASVTTTNQHPFHRVLLVNATNVPPVTLTQSTAFITITWKGNGKTNLLERLANTWSESYETVSTNTSTGTISVIRPFQNDTYRVVW